MSKEDDCEKEFISTLESIAWSKNSSELFYDFLVMTSAVLYSWKKDKKIEEEYQKIAKSYSKNQLEKFSHLLTLVIDALTRNECDFLGSVFIKLDLSSKARGQYFTPHSISKVISNLTIIDNEFEPGKIISVYDPCCGSGGMLIESAFNLKSKGCNYQHDALFIAEDIDASCCYITFIQLSLFGMPAIVRCGNSLSRKFIWERETFFYHFNNVGSRFKIQREKEDCENPVSNEDEVKMFLETKII
jgi:hypothetical protein